MGNLRAWSTTTQGNRFFRGHFRQQLKPPFCYVESSIVLLKFKFLNYFEKMTMKLSKKTLFFEWVLVCPHQIWWGFQLFGLGFLLFYTTWQKIKNFCSWLIIDDSVIILFNFVCSCCGFLDHFWRRKPTFHACSCSCVVVSQAVVSTVFLQIAHCYKYKSKMSILRKKITGKVFILLPSFEEF